MDRAPPNIEPLRTLDETIKAAQELFAKIERDPALGVSVERKMAVRSALATAHGHVTYIRHVAELRARKPPQAAMHASS